MDQRYSRHPTYLANYSISHSKSNFYLEIFHKTYKQVRTLYSHNSFVYIKNSYACTGCKQTFKEGID